MKRHMAFLAPAVGCALLLSTLGARGDGIMVPRETSWRVLRERAMINEPAQKAAIFFRRGQEDLIISPSYSGPASQFAWLVPVPARPRVRIVEGALFHELAALTVPKRDALPQHEMAKAVAGARPLGVTLLERETVGAYDVSVLAANRANALMEWLAANGYHLPREAEGPAAQYVREGWTFVACRIKTPGKDATRGLVSGTLAPLRLTFPAKRPVYPMRLSAANPSPFTVLVYLLLPASETGGRPRSIALADAPDPRAGRSTAWKATAAAEQTEYPTLANFTSQEVHVYLEYMRIAPDESTRDLVWAPTRTPRISTMLLPVGLGILLAGGWGLAAWRWRSAARARVPWHHASSR